MSLAVAIQMDAMDSIDIAGETEFSITDEESVNSIDAR